MDLETRKPWDRLPSEPDLWFERFEVYRMLGPMRSLARTFRVCSDDPEQGLTGKGPSSAWSDRSREWRWRERARSWDEEERRKLREEEEDVRRDTRAARLQMIRELMARTYTALMTANIDTLSRDEARGFFSQLRLMMVALLGAERSEFKGADDLMGDDGSLSEDLEENLKAALEKVYGKKLDVDGD